MLTDVDKKTCREKNIVFIYEAGGSETFLFEFPVPFFLFDADDVFLYLIKKRDDLKERLKRVVWEEDGSIVAIMPEAERVVLAKKDQENPDKLVGRRFTMEYLGISDFSYDGNLFVRSLWTVFDFFKKKTMNYFLFWPDCSLKSLNKSNRMTKRNKRKIVVTYIQTLDDARVIKEKIEDSHSHLGDNYFLIKAISFYKELERLKKRNPRKYDEVKRCSATWKKLEKLFTDK